MCHGLADLDSWWTSRAALAVWKPPPRWKLDELMGGDRLAAQVDGVDFRGGVGGVGAGTNLTDEENFWVGNEFAPMVAVVRERRRYHGDEKNFWDH